MLFFYVFHCFLIIFVSTNSSFLAYPSSYLRNMALNFDSEPNETLSPSKNSSYFSQNKFKKSFKFLHNDSEAVFIQINFTKITSKTNFPLISLSNHCENCSDFSENLNNSFNANALPYDQFDFESFFARKTTHYLEYNKYFYNHEEVLYLTIFNLFTNSEEFDNFLEYFITMRTGNLTTPCYEIWGDSECEYKAFILQPNEIKLRENYQFQLKNGEMKYFYSNFMKNISDSQLFIKTSNFLVFLKVMNIEKESENEHKVYLNSAGFYYFEKNFSFPDYYYYDDHLSFILFAPFKRLNETTDEISINIRISEKNSDLNDEIEQNKLRNIVYTISILGITAILLCIFLSLLNSYFKFRRERTYRENNEEKLTKEDLNNYFTAKNLEFFKKNSNYSRECAICLQDFTNDDMCRELYCLHLFHETCIDIWIILHQTCPVCRKEYKKSILEKEKDIYLEKMKAIMGASCRNSGHNLLSTHELLNN